MQLKSHELSSRFSKASLKQNLHPVKWIRNNVETFKMIFKMAAPPAMVAALIESSYWINYFKEFMYIMAILAHACAGPGLPRAVLISTNWNFTVAWAILYCWALLAGWSSVQAREHTGELEPYSASASAIIAMFLMFGCWVCYSLRSMMPQLTLVLITCKIYLVATLPGLIELRTTKEVINVASLILECFLVGQAIGLTIGLLFFPRSSRTMFMTSVESSLLALSSAITEQPDCLERLVHHPDQAAKEGVDAMNQLKSNLDKFAATVAKVQLGVHMAGQEWTYSHLSRGDLKTIADHLTMISAPLAGLNALFEKVMMLVSEASSGEGEEAAGEHKEFVTVSKQYAEELASSIEGGIKHAIACLGSRSSSSRHVDPACLNSQCHHVAVFEKTLLKYRTSKGELSLAAEQYLMKQLIRDTRNLSTTLPYGALVGCFLSSHLIQLLSATGYEFQQLLLFLDATSHQKRRIYTPVQNLFSDLRIRARVLMNGSSSQMLYGSVFLKVAPKVKHDVDHLSPTTPLEKVGDTIRRFWKIFSSPHAAFGVRGALAIMTVAILAFLKDEHAFYNEQRFLWALFSIALCLDRTAGSSTLRLIFRFFATLASMVASYIIWYIVDQQVAGAIVLLFVWYCVLSWYQLKSPKYGPAAFTALVAATVMICNQLQVKKLGARKVEASGQAVYKSYILFPLRLAQVTLGIFVAYFWTLFPSPLPEHTELRLQAAEAVLNLATYSSSVHQSVSIQFGGKLTKIKSEPEIHLHRLRSRHRAHLTEHTVLIRQLQGTMKTIPYEFSLGGKFPLNTYRKICTCISQLGDIFTLIGYISHTLNGQQLARDMNAGDKEVLDHLCPQGMGARLIILCSALRTGHPLPPVLHVLQIPDLRHFLDRRVATDESFATASLIHSANFMAVRNINELTQLISDVVGVLDFTLPLAELEEEMGMSTV